VGTKKWKLTSLVTGQDERLDGLLTQVIQGLYFDNTFNKLLKIIKVGILHGLMI